MHFAKVHGNGNDFAVFDEYDQILVPENQKPRFVKKVCQRRFGVGADGVIFIQRSNTCDIKFRYFNSDGTEAEMCGNGIRCFVRVAYEHHHIARVCTVETLAGSKEVEVVSDSPFLAKVDMGEVVLDDASIPVVNAHHVMLKGFNLPYIEVEGYRVYALNTGVPHAVVFLDNIDGPKVMEFAKTIRYHPSFPKGTNVNLVRVDPDAIQMRTYERGVEAETLSCGTGTVATAITSWLLGYAGDEVNVETKGGSLRVDVKTKENRLFAYLVGGAVKVYEARLCPDFLD